MKHEMFYVGDDSEYVAPNTKEYAIYYKKGLTREEMDELNKTHWNDYFYKKAVGTYDSDVDINKIQNIKYFKFVKTIKAKDLDDVYWLMQGENWSPHGEAKGFIRFLGLTHTSMSIGDVILDLEYLKFYQVADHEAQGEGFVEVNF